MFLATLLVTLAPQCTDPQVPTGGFAISEQLDIPVLFSDGESTNVDVRMPAAAPGSCGWPLVVFVHGLFGSKDSVEDSGQDFASWGYATLTFDVRGHASSSGEHTFFALRERLDLAELIGWINTNFASSIDADRIALAGGSQGAILSWSAAAWGGEQFEPNPWITGTYPEIDAIVVDNLTADFAITFAPRAAAVHCSGAAALLGQGTVRFDPQLQATALGALTAQNYASWSALVSDPLRDPNSHLQTMNVPVMVMTAWDDFWFPPTSIVDTWQTLTPGTPRKLYLGTGGHSTPSNHAERVFRDKWRRAWFDHFIKGADNHIDEGAPITYAITPSDPSAYLANTTSWTRAATTNWPPPNTRDYRLFLRETAGLSPFAPSTAEPSDALAQVVQPGYGLAQMIADDFRLGFIEPNIPRATLSYDSAPLANSISYAGDARMRVSLDSATTRYQVCASLWDVAPNGQARYVSSGGHFVFDDAPSGANAFEVVLTSNAYEFAEGNRIRVQLCNLQLHQPPTGEALRFAPYPHDFSLAIEHRPSALSWLDLPLDERQPIVYGTAQINSLGCEPSISASGVSGSTDVHPLVIEARNIVSDKDGLLVYGFQLQRRFLHGGWLYVRAPLYRTAVQNSAGNLVQDDCSGVLRFDFNSHAASGVNPALIPGTRVFAQYWSRDPGAQATTNLTDAVEFTLVN